VKVIFAFFHLPFSRVAQQVILVWAPTRWRSKYVPLLERPFQILFFPFWNGSLERVPLLCHPLDSFKSVTGALGAEPVGLILFHGASQAIWQLWPERETRVNFRCYRYYYLCYPIDCLSNFCAAHKSTKAQTTHVLTGKQRDAVVLASSSRYLLFW